MSLVLGRKSILIVALTAAALSACAPGESSPRSNLPNSPSQLDPTLPSASEQNPDIKAHIESFIEGYATYSSLDSGEDIVARRVAAGGLPSGTGASDPTWNIPNWGQDDFKQTLKSISFIDIQYPFTNGKVTIDTGFVTERTQNEKTREVMYACTFLYTAKSDDGFIYGADCVDVISDLEEA